MEANSFTVQLDEIRQEEFYGLAASYSAIVIQHEILPASTSLLERFKWPLIGSLAAIALIVILTSAFCLLKNHSNSGVSVNINNAAYSSHDSPVCTEAIVNQANPIIIPSCPAAIEIQDDAPVQDTPPDYYSTVDIKAILAISPRDRNAFERRAVTQHMAKLEENPLPQNQA